MESVKQRFQDLATVIDGVHAMFDQWPTDHSFNPDVDLEAVHRMKLAVHEWIANLVQHADFTRRQPDISIDVWVEGNKILCVVEDNSDGFDLDAHLVVSQAALDALPERGMGLLMLQACASDLYYGQVGDGRYRVKFSVSADQDPWLNIPF
jgi:serine/threonine-protein kinase RsbW